MNRLLRIIFPFVLIALFLAPQVTLAVHQFEHSRDIHCDNTKMHFHEQEHHCLICEFNVTLTSADIFKHQPLEALYRLTGILSCHNSFKKFSFAHTFFSLRAPPEIA